MGKKGKRKRLREAVDKMRRKQMLRNISPEDSDPIIFGGDEEEENQQQNISNSAEGTCETKFNWKQEQQEHHNLQSSPEDNGDEEDEKLSPDDLQCYLELYTKDHLISLIADAAVDDPDFLSRIRVAADKDITHRKIFIRGLGWDVTKEILFDAFRPYGRIAECNLVVDRATGRNKGFGFIVFSTRKAAEKALKSPVKKVGFRKAICNLASLGSTPTSSSTPVTQRRIYVSNVHPDTSPEKLKSFFATFGEIDSGPIGFDSATGKSRGFAIFLYKTQEGAARALQEPYKMFEGHQLHCMISLDNLNNGQIFGPQAIHQSLPITNQQLIQHKFSNQNPSQSMFVLQRQLIANPNLNQNSMVALNPSTFAAFNTVPNLVTPQGQGYVGFGGGSSILGTYRAQENVNLPYGGLQLGQTFSAAPANNLLWRFPY